MGYSKFTLLGLVLVFTQSDFQTERFEVRYFAFGNFTIESITPENIGRQYNISSLIADDKEKLMAIFVPEKEESSFDAKQVRMRIEKGNEIILVDCYGNCNKSDRYWALSKFNQEQLYNLLRSRIPGVNRFRKK